MIDKYFSNATLTSYANISDFINGEYKNEDFNKTSRNSEESADFSVRVGSKLWSDKEGLKRSDPFIIHEKWKGHAFANVDWFDKESTGRLTLKTIDNRSVNLPVSEIKKSYGKDTKTLIYDFNNELGTFDSKTDIGDIKNKVLVFNLYDQQTDSSTHHGTAAVFPFGK